MILLRFKFSIFSELLVEPLKVAVLKGPYQIEIEERDKPVPGPNQVLIRVRTVSYTHLTLPTTERV